MGSTPWLCYRFKVAISAPNLRTIALKTHHNC